MNLLRSWQRKPRDIRFLVYFALIAGVAAWKYIPRSWHPDITLRTTDHILYSTATRRETEDTAHALKLLYLAYTNRLSEVVRVHEPHAPLRMKLYKDRNEMRGVHPNMGWAEAFYTYPYCYAYYSAKEENPYHWMLHESVHQLNHEVAHFHLAKWLEEGLAEYFSTSRLRDHELALGHIDPNAYPVWWMELIATAPTLEENLENKSVIPLRAIILNRGGPSMNAKFNLYYLHWWTLTHFIFEDERYRTNAVKLAERGGGLEAFESIIGPVEKVQREWHEHVRHLKQFVDKPDRQFLRTGKGSNGGSQTNE